MIYSISVEPNTAMYKISWAKGSTPMAISGLYTSYAFAEKAVTQYLQATESEENRLQAQRDAEEERKMRRPSYAAAKAKEEKLKEKELAESNG